MIAIIDYGMGNLRSVQKALERVGAQTIIAEKPETILGADSIVLPGVGAMPAAMERLQNLQMIDAIINAVNTKKPFLGICLGLQLLFEESSEGGTTKGLGLIKGKVKKFTEGKVPQMGWNQITIRKNDSLFADIKDQSDVYFCHSYYVEPEDNSITSAMTHYGLDFTSAIQHDNISAVQFHPEKSQTVGLKILENFVRSTQ